MSEIIKCNRCWSKELKFDDFYFNKDGERYKSCNTCRDYDKQRKHNNKEAINQQAREHYQDIKDTKIEKVKQYRIDNYERLHEIYKCECGGKYEYRNKYRHIKTIKHEKYLEKQDVQS